MKPFLLLFAASVLVAPLPAQDNGPGTDLIELFEKSQREGASDEELMKMLERKGLIELQDTRFREVTPEELKRENDAADEMRLRSKGTAERGDGGMPNVEAMPGQVPGPVPPQAPRWLVGLVVRPLDPALRLHFDLQDGAGMLVESVMRGSPAAKAGIKRNDIVVTADGRKISSLEALKKAVEKAGSEGKAMNLEVIQRGKRSVVEVKPRDPEDPAAKAKPTDPGPAKRPMIEIQRRLEQQQQEIEALRREVRELRARLDQK